MNATNLTVPVPDVIIFHEPSPLGKLYNIHKIFYNSKIHPPANELDGQINEHEPISEGSYDAIGVVIALLVSVVIIVGVAFIIRKLRSKQDTPEDDDYIPDIGNGDIESGEKPSVISSSEEKNPQIFTISFTEIPKKESRLHNYLPTFLRPKPKVVTMETIRKDFGKILVY